MARLRPLLLLSLFAAAASAQWTGEGPYPNAKTGGNYMHNYYLPPASSTPWRPAFSPDGEEIAFSMAGSLWKIRIGETTAHELTAEPTVNSSPAYSPDGRWIAYTSDQGYKSINLRLLDLTTGETHALTQGEFVNLDPVFAPDGRSLYYVSTEPDGWYNLFRLPLDEAGNPGKPIRLTLDHDFHNARLYFGQADLHIEPTISPDGSEMILVSNRDISLGSGAVWRAKIGPNMMQDAEMVLREETLYRTRPQWSPDGTRILYSSHRGSQYNNLYVLPVKGGEPYQLTFGSWDHFEPRWSPDGEWIVYVSNEHGLSDLRLLRTFGGEEKRIEIRERVWKRPMGTLEITVRDGEAGPPTEAKVMLTGADGKAWAPPDAYHRVGIRALFPDFFHTTGTFRLQLPVGEAKLTVMKGFERLPVDRTVVIPDGRVARAEIVLERLTNFKAEGWYSGSDHVHMNYGGNLHNTPENLLFMAAAEDLDVVGEKIANKDNRIFDHQYWTGGYDEKRSTPERLLSFGEEYRPPFYGHINFINLTQHLLSPFTTGYEGTAIESLYPSNTDMFRLGRKQGALSGHVHPFPAVPETNDWANARGFPIDLALGSFDYLEVMTGAGYSKYSAPVWHKALNCGFRVTPTGGEDSISNLHWTPALGAARFYAYVGDKLEWSRWLDAIREGRTFYTNGPLVGLEVNGEGPGGEIRLPAGGGSVEVTANMQTAFPVERVELIFRGEVVKTIPLQNGGRQAFWRGSVPVERSGWFTLRAVTDEPVPPIDDANLHAETAAVYTLVGEEPIRSRADAEYFVHWIDEVTKLAEAHPGWRSEKEKAHVLGQFREARAIMEQRALEAKD
ncbi:MAG: hypothetical protein GC160_01405 [Acidobacteria bacterium]|nr:hypothetical protein [Acidobacteriota bacterium]